MKSLCQVFVSTFSRDPLQASSWLIWAPYHLALVWAKFCVLGAWRFCFPEPPKGSLLRGHLLDPNYLWDASLVTSSGLAPSPWFNSLCRAGTGKWRPMGHLCVYDPPAKNGHIFKKKFLMKIKRRILFCDTWTLYELNISVPINKLWWEHSHPCSFTYCL